jgi:hypothetical protein
MRKFIGEIVEYDGCICVQVRPNLYYPLAGSSGLAADFRDAFYDVQASDIGRGLWNVDGVLQMETVQQAQERREGNKA